MNVALLKHHNISHNSGCHSATAARSLSRNGRVRMARLHAVPFSKAQCSEPALRTGAQKMCSLMLRYFFGFSRIAFIRPWVSTSI